MKVIISIEIFILTKVIIGLMISLFLNNESYPIKYATL